MRASDGKLKSRISRLSRRKVYATNTAAASFRAIQSVAGAKFRINGADCANNKQFKN
jgi:hypothetical protein